MSCLSWSSFLLPEQFRPGLVRGPDRLDGKRNHGGGFPVREQVPLRRHARRGRFRSPISASRGSACRHSAMWSGAMSSCSNSPGSATRSQSPEFMFYLKRAVALCGDTVQIVNRVLMSTGSPAPLPRNMKFNSYPHPALRRCRPAHLPEGDAVQRRQLGPGRGPRKGRCHSPCHREL